MSTRGQNARFMAVTSLEALRGCWACHPLPPGVVPYFGKGGMCAPPSQLSMLRQEPSRTAWHHGETVLTTAKLTSFFGLHRTAIHFCSELKGISFLRV